MPLQKKTLAALGVAGAIGLAGIGGQAMAQTDETGSLVDRLVERFQLDKGEVQQVVDSYQGDRHAQMEQRLTERLDAAVKAGTITGEQKEKILAKHEELEAKREALRDKTPEERREAMAEQRGELRAWAEANGIPAGIIGDGMHGRDGMHGGGFGPRG